MTEHHHTGVTLFVDDDQDYRFFLERAMKMAGLDGRCQFVSSAYEAIEYLRGAGQYAGRFAHPFPDMLFLDVRMPKMTGFDLLRWMHDQPQYRVTPTIVLSSSRLVEDRQRAYALGANSYIAKPDRYPDLSPMLRAAHEFWAFCEKAPAPVR